MSWGPEGVCFSLVLAAKIAAADSLKTSPLRPARAMLTWRKARGLRAGGIKGNAKHPLNPPCQLRARYNRGPRLPSSEPAAALCAARTSEMTDVGPVWDASCPSCLDAFHLPQHGVVPLLAGIAVDVGSIHGELATVHVAEILNVSPDGLFPA